MIHLLAIAFLAIGFVGGLQFGGAPGAALGLFAAFLSCGLGLGTIALLFEIRDNLVQMNSHRADGEARPEVNRREPQLGH
jgi:hypothetical protein